MTRALLTALSAVVFPWLAVATQRLPEPEDAGFEPGAFLILGLLSATAAALGLGVFLVLVCLAFRLEGESAQRR